MKKSSKILAMIFAIAISFTGAFVGFGPAITVKAAEYTIDIDDSWEMIPDTNMGVPCKTYEGTTEVEADYTVSVINDPNSIIDEASYDNEDYDGYLFIYVSEDARIGQTATVRVVSKQKNSDVIYVTKDITVSVVEETMVAFDTNELVFEKEDTGKKSIHVSKVYSVPSNTEYSAKGYRWKIGWNPAVMGDGFNADDYFYIENNGSDTYSLRVKENVTITKPIKVSVCVYKVLIGNSWKDIESYYDNRVEVTVNPREGKAKEVTAKPASTGTTVSDASTKAEFKVTSSDEGNATVSFEGIKDNASSVVIPSVIKDANGVEYKVTSVSENAFAKNSKIKTVEIPETVTSIGKNAFKGCKNLKNIKLNANTLKTVGKNAFKGIKKNAKITVVSKNKKAYNTFVKKLKRSGLKGAKFKFKKG